MRARAAVAPPAPPLGQRGGVVRGDLQVLEIEARDALEGRSRDDAAPDRRLGLVDGDVKYDGRRFAALEAMCCASLDKAVEALVGSDGKVMLSDQALLSGNDNKPPIDAEGEKVPVKKRVANAREALYGAKEEGAK